MRIHSVVVTAATLLGALMIASPLHAAQVLVTVEGSYSLSGGVDTNDLNGATFVGTYLYDDTASPSSSSSAAQTLCL